MRRLLIFLLAAPLMAQTVVNVSSTPAQTGIYGPAIDPSFLTYYGAGQIYRDLVFANGGSLTGYYSDINITCSAGGTQTATNWYYNNTEPSPYNFAANFWNTATYQVWNSAAGTLVGSGTITASTPNPTSGMNLTMSPGIGSACSSGYVMRLWLPTPTIPLTPSQYFYNLGSQVDSASAFETTDLPTGAVEALSIPNTTSWTMNVDATYPNTSNTNSTLSTQQVNFIHINGVYDYSFPYKCNAASGTGAVAYSIARTGAGGTTWATGTLTPSCNPTAGAGWTTQTGTFTASETCSPTGVGTCPQGNVQFKITANSANILIGPAHLTERSTLSPANTSVYRDDVVRTLRSLKPGLLRFMDPSWWCANPTAMESTSPAFCSTNAYTPYLALYGTQNFHDAMGLCVAVGTNCYLSVSQFFTQSDWAALPAWLAGDSNYAALKSAGYKVFLAHGNEAFNSSAGGTLSQGDGVLYGAIMGPDFNAFYLSPSYDAAHMIRVGNNWFASNQSNPSGSFGWVYNVLHQASLSTHGLPDYMELAPYNFGYLGSFTTSGSNVGTTGEPWTGMMAQIANFDSISSPPSGYQSVLASTNYIAANFPSVKSMVYEYNSGLLSGITASQLQLDQIAAGVGQSLAMSEHYLLMQRDGGITGPIGAFDLSGGLNKYNNATPPSVPIWHLMRNMACGSGELSTCSAQPTPQFLALEVIGNALGSNLNRMTLTQSGTPTYNYPGGQSNGSSNTIAANSAVNYVNAFAYSNGAGNWTVFLYNLDPSASHAVTLAGAGAPTGTVTQILYPNSGNLITDHNENTYVGSGSLAPLVTLPAPTSTSGTSYTVPPASFLALTYSTSAITNYTLTVGTAGTGTGTVSGTNCTSGTYPSGTVINCTASAGAGSTFTGWSGGSCSGTGTCSFTLSANATVTATFNITTYTFAVSTAGSGSGTLSGTNCANGTYNTGTSISCSASAATGSSFTSWAGTGSAASCSTNPCAFSLLANSTATATFTQLVTATPTFSPAAGTYSSPQTVTISDATVGSTIYYTLDGSTPTTSSTVYSSPISIPATTTVKAIATATGYAQSAVGSAAYTINLLGSPVNLSGKISVSGKVTAQ